MSAGFSFGRSTDLLVERLGAREPERGQSPSMDLRREGLREVWPFRIVRLKKGPDSAENPRDHVGKSVETEHTTS